MANLITAQQVIDNAFTNKNTDIFLIKDNFIEVAQEEHVRHLLGDDLYDLIRTENDADSLSTANQTLVDTYIIPMLAFYVKFEVIPDISVNSTSKGLVVLTDQTSEPASNQQRSEIQRKAISHAETLRDKLTRFIEDDDNIGDYPLYQKGANITSKVQKRGGIVIRKR